MLPTMHNGLLDSQHQDGCGAHQLQPGEEEEEEGGVERSTCAAVLSVPLSASCLCRCLCLFSLCLRMESAALSKLQ